MRVRLAACAIIRRSWTTLIENTMQYTELEVFQTLRDWLAAGQSAHLFTLLHTWGAAPRPVGALLAIREDGCLVGSVSGGCVEENLRERVLAGAFQQISTLEYGVQTEDAQRFGLPCGGTMQVLQEPIRQLGQIEPLLQALSARQLIGRQVCLASGEVQFFTAETELPLRWENGVLRQVYGPAWQLLLIGAGQIAHYLAQFALALNYRVIICDPREHYAHSWGVADCVLDTQMPDDAVLAHVRDDRNAVITLTHDPKLDDLALLAALASPAFYVGALGSRRSSASRRARLLELEVSPAQVARLHAPVGLPIGSHTPPEIALSALAEVTAIRNRL